MITGPMPKDPEDRNNRNPKLISEKDRIFLEEHDGLVGPNLPRGAWCNRTKAWWNTWRASPQAKLLTPTDWESMFEAALIHNEVWKPRPEGKQLGHVNMVNLLGELRRKVAAFGATHEDRVKLRISIKSPLEEDNTEKRIQEDAKGAVDYVERLTKYAAKETKVK